MSDELTPNTNNQPASPVAVEPCPPFVGLDPNLAVKSFFQDPDWILKTAIGGVMNASSMLLFLLIRESPVLIPLMFSLWALNTGYVLRTIRERLKVPNGRLPIWNDWQDLFVSGMSWLAVMTGLLIFLVTITATDLLVASILTSIKAKPFPLLSTLWMSGSIILIFSLSFLINLLLVATMANFAEEESMNSAFAFIKVLKRISKRPGDFISAWMLGMGIQFLSIAVPCATVIGIFFLPSTVFAGQLLTASLIAQAWKSAHHFRLKAIEETGISREPKLPKDKRKK